MISEKKSLRLLILLGVWAACANPGVGQTPSPTLVVVVKEENAVNIIDPIAKSILGKVTVGEGPHEVEASTDGQLAFVSNYGLQNGAVNPGQTISVIDLAARKEVRRVDLGARSRPHGLCYAAGKLYFTTEGSKIIGRYDPATNEVDWRLGVGQNRTHMILPSKDLNLFFTSNIDSDSITVIERAPEPLDWAETVISVGKGPEAIDISPEGKEVWTAQGGDGKVSVIDVAGKKVIQTIDLSMKRSNRLKFTLDGKRVLISDARGNQVVVVDATSRKEIKRLDLGRAPQGILMAPDRLHAYVAINGDNNIAIVDVKTLELTGRIPTGKGPDGLAWAGPR
jgi:YVTN family beta-propeller protein